MDRPKYSLLVINYNTADTIEASMKSILDQIDDRFEIVVVDSHSTDSSVDYLMKLRMEGKIRLYRSGSYNKIAHRGFARQEALEWAWGDYILAHVDIDDIYKPRLKEFVELYHREHEGHVLSAKVFMLPRELALKIGWHDINRHDDVDFCARAQNFTQWDRLSEDYFIESLGRNAYRKKLTNRLRTRLEKYTIAYRLGMSPLYEIDYNLKFGLMTYDKAFALLALIGLGWLIAKIKGKYSWASEIKPDAWIEIENSDFARMKLWTTKNL